MSKGSRNPKKPQPRSDGHSGANQPRHEATDHASTIPDVAFFIGILLIASAIALTGVLVANHLGSLSLPGCRPGGACEQAAAGFWGKVPGTSWPISFVGLAYFIGLMLAWLTSKGGVSPQLKLLVRVGALISVMYLVVLLINKHACYYCIGTHIANLIFWLLMEQLRPSRAVAWRPIAVTAVVFLLASVALGAREHQDKQAESDRQEDALAESTREIIKASANQTTQPAKTSTPVVAEPEEPRPWKGGFTGRYRLGPEEAAIRIVMFTDYQCPDCRRTERDLMNLMNARSDVSVSIKHFPFCPDCNHGIKTNLHPNACWAARAAETAGILRGSEGFWEMHKWLFDAGGSFTNTQFTEMLTRLGYDPANFTNIMQTKATLELVQNDVNEAIWLGLHYTPMIFINGRELKGVFAHEALSRAVIQIAATNPPPATCANDQPPPAADKYISDWKEGELQLPGQDQYAWPMGPDGAPLHIVMWGDYQEPNTAKADAIIRKFIDGRKDAQYVFRHYPVNQQCNPMSQLTRHPNACRMSQVTEAAGMLLGTDGFWKLHNWLMQNQSTYSDDALREVAKGMGFLPDALLLKMDSPEVAEGIRHDCESAKQLGLTAVPCIFVNQRFVPRWHREGDNILEKVFQAAIEENEARLRNRPEQAAAK